MQSTVAQPIRITYGGIKVFANIKTQNILITGAPGSGKTNAVRDLCRQIRLADQKMIRVVEESQLVASEVRPTDIVFSLAGDRFSVKDMWNAVSKGDDDKFYLRRWAADDRDRRCVFLTYKDDTDKKPLEPLYSRALDIATKELLDNQPPEYKSRELRVWVIQDDWIIDYPMMEEVLAVGCGVGIASIISTFGLAQLEQLCGTGNAERIWQCCGAWLIHRAPSSEEAKAISDLINPMVGVLGNSKVKQIAVRPAEIQMLESCSCIAYIRDCSPAVVNIPFTE